MNYIFQKKNYNSYQCGAYAIYNALQFTGINDKVKLKYLIRQCKAQKGTGTLEGDFNSAIDSINNVITIRPVEATLTNIKRACETGGLAPLILLFHWSEGAHQGNHYALIDNMYYKYGSYSYRIINYSFDKPVHIISERELKNILMPYEDDHFQLPRLWTVLL